MSNPIYDDPKVDWRFKAMLQKADAAWDDKTKRLKAGEIHRSDSGMRSFWRDTLPSEEERRAAKDALVLDEEGRPVGFDSYCPCCNRHYGFPSAWVSVQEHGLCGTCRLFEEGKFDGVEAFRLPTLEEAMSVSGVRSMEGYVLQQALKKALGI